MLQNFKRTISLRSLALIVLVCFSVEAATMLLMQDMNDTAPIVTAVANALISALAVSVCLALWVVPELSRSKKQALDQAEMMESLIKAIPAPVFYKDEHGVYSGCNQRFENYIGKTVDQIIGRTVYDVSPSDLAKIYHKADLDLIAKGGTQVYETVVSHANGSKYDVMFHKAVFNKSDGSVGGIIGVILDISERKMLERKLQTLASIDDLTQIPNRREMESRIKQALLRSERTGDEIALLYIDMDGFKDVNDLHGHEAGDEVLKLIGMRITDLLRKSDVAGRMGGDEFAVMLEGNVSTEATRVVADKLLKTLSKSYVLSNGGAATISASIGIAFAPGNGTDIKTLLAEADDAMYASKNEGKNTMTFASGQDEEPG